MKSSLKYFFWTVVLIVCVISFAVVTQLYNPAEKVNALWLTTSALCFLMLGYRFYGRLIARNITNLDDSRTTPSERLNNGHDYVPTNCNF